MKLCLIVAVSKNGYIGKDGSLPWQISEDLKRFRKITSISSTLFICLEACFGEISKINCKAAKVNETAMIICKVVLSKKNEIYLPKNAKSNPTKKTILKTSVSTFPFL